MNAPSRRSPAKTIAPKISFGFRFSGFTLVELIVVITILSVLATVGFLALSGYSQDARESAMKTNLKSVQTAIFSESAITGNSPRYYVVHDTGSALSGAVAYVDGNPVVLTGGNVWEVPLDSNYSAGNPNFARLKLNPEKFRISGTPGFVLAAMAATDPSEISIGAFDVTAASSGGKKRTTSWVQIAAVAPSTGIASVVGNFPVPSAAEIASGAVVWLIAANSAENPNAALVNGVSAGTQPEPTEGWGTPAGTGITWDDATGRRWADGTYASSCKAYVTPAAGYSYQGSTGDGTYWIDPTGGSNSDAFKTYCEMTTDGGGWTLAMKIDGTKTTFAYDAAYWTDTSTLNPDTGLGISNTEYKGAAYSTVAYSGLLIKTQSWATVRSVSLPWSGTSLYAKIQPGTAVTEAAVAAAEWNNLVPNGYLQTTKHVSGYNFKYTYIGTRIGAIGENSADITLANSMVGLGGWKSGTHADVPSAWARNHDQFPMGYSVGWRPVFAYLYVR